MAAEQRRQHFPTQSDLRVAVIKSIGPENDRESNSEPSLLEEIRRETSNGDLRQSNGSRLIPKCNQYPIKARPFSFKMTLKGCKTR
ncbi:jg18012 [Pararge aegeria aegeria]|uniref:Jg18012 protein n=1 Tax=Pararge aegeria aegeria TaxID=348720 RepID=A0A8S4RNL0_9NEOP|nr:jg18012 [Pararge aegeria aegeria]